jgi:signal transduction histidine kinase
MMISAGLLEQDVPKSYIEDARHDILDAVERCDRLITKTKRAGQIRGLPNTGVDVSGVVAEKARVLERVYGAKVHIEGFDDPVWIRADSLLGEMLWNILENAARHNPKDDKQVWVSGTKAEHFFELAVADNGPGLSDDRKKILFDKSRRSGGVGLTLVAQMVRKYGGRIDVQDRVSGRPSMGAKFVLQFQYSEPT